MLLRREDSFLLIVDFQERLIPAMRAGAAALETALRLTRAARRLGVPVRVSEHCADRIGPSAASLRAEARQGEILAKTHFSLAREPGALDALRALGRRRPLIVGIEAHVCVLQTALGLKEAGFDPLVAADGVSSRFERDEQLGIARMAAGGIEVVSTEMALFEWLERAGTDEFRDVLALIKAR